MTSTYKPTEAACELPQELPLMFKISEAAPILNVSRKHLNDMLREGRIRGTKLGTTWRIPRGVILEILGAEE